MIETFGFELRYGPGLNLAVGLANFQMKRDGGRYGIVEYRDRVGLRPQIDHRLIGGDEGGGRVVGKDRRVGCSTVTGKARADVRCPKMALHGPEARKVEARRQFDRRDRLAHPGCPRELCPKEEAEIGGFALIGPERGVSHTQPIEKGCALVLDADVPCFAKSALGVQQQLFGFGPRLLVARRKGGDQSTQLRCHGEKMDEIQRDLPGQLAFRSVRKRLQILQFTLREGLHSVKIA